MKLRKIFYWLRGAPKIFHPELQSEIVTCILTEMNNAPREFFKKTMSLMCYVVHIQIISFQKEKINEYCKGLTKNLEQEDLCKA